jgi:hypothetical protein
VSLTSLLLAGLLGATVTGCAGNQEAGQQAGEQKPAAAPVDPKAALASSTSGLKAGNYAFTGSTPDTSSEGVMHFASKSAAVKSTSRAKDAAGTFELRYVDPDQYLKISMDTKEITAGLADMDTSNPEMKKMVDGLRQMAEMFSGKYWMQMDRSKVTGREFNLDVSDGDITGLTELLSKATVTKGDAKTITGTLDATTIDDNDGMVDTDDIKAMGAAAKSLPYTATLDEQGRLSDVTIDVPKAGDTPAGTWTFAVTGYGAQKAQQKPSGQIRKTPASAYEMLNK